MKNEWLSIPDFAQYEGVGKRAIEQRIKRGKIPKNKLDRQAGQGGQDGLKTYIHVSALSPDAREAYDKTVARTQEQEQPSGTGRVITPEMANTMPRPKTGRLPEAEYWLTVKEAALYLGKGERHTRRLLCTEENVGLGHVRKEDDGGWRIHAHLLPSRALQGFYWKKKKPMPDYLLRELPGLPLDSMSQQERDYIVNWKRLLNSFETFHLMQAGATLEQSATRFCRYADPSLGQGLKFSPSTLIKKRLRYKKQGLMGLRVQKRGGKRKAELPPDAWDWLKRNYARYNGNRSQAIEALEVKARDMGWKLPSSWTMMKRLKEVPEALFDYYKRGNKMFNDKVLPSNLRDYASFPAMFCWVSDHHEFDLMVTWPDGSVKRVWLTVWQDMRSRKIVGMMFSDNPNSETIALALRDAIKSYGIPQHVIVDNGKDYRSRRLRGALTQNEQEVERRLKGVYEHLGIRDHYAIPYNAKSKPCERTFRRFKEQVCALLPGYTGGNVTERPERLQREQDHGELLRVDDFEGLFRRWVDERYHTTRHRGHGMQGRSPNQAHEEECVEYGHASEAHLRLLLLKPSDVRTYGRNGFQLFNQRYLVPAERHAELLGQKFWLRYHPEDFDQVHVYDLEDRYVCDADIVARSKLFDDEESLKQNQKYKKEVKAAARAELNAAQSIFRRDIPPAERIGLGKTYVLKQDDGRPKGAVARLVPDQTAPDALDSHGVAELPIENDVTQRIDDSFTRAIAAKMAVNDDDDVPEELQQAFDASFSRLIRNHGGDDE